VSDDHRDLGSAEDPRFPRVPRRAARADRPVRRRQRTRRLLAVLVLGLALVLAGAEALLRAKPVVDVTELQVDVPPLALAETRSCTRRPDDPTADEIRAEFLPGGRVSSTQLFACPAAFDGLRVSFAGELIGELLPRRGGVWVQVNDDPYALDVGPIGAHLEQRGFSTGVSAWLPDGLHELVDGVGRHEIRGDVVLLEGVFVRADATDGGGSTVRADRLEVLAPTVEVPEPLHVVQALVAAVLTLLALMALFLARRARQR
jgi:hypothetical protein